MTKRNPTDFVCELSFDYVEGADGTRLCWQSTPAIEGQPALVIVNGPGADYRAWRGFFAEFNHEYRIITWDYRGLFDSNLPADRQNLSVHDHAEDLRSVLDAAGEENVILISWSLGTQISLEFLRQNADRVLAMISVNGSYGRPFERSAGLRRSSRLAQIAGFLPRQSDRLESVVNFVNGHPEILAGAKLAGLLSPVLSAEQFTPLAEAFTRLNMDVYRRTLTRFGEHDAEGVLPTLRCPALFFAGKRDPLVPSRYSEYMARVVLRSELLIVPIATHYIPVEFAEYLNLKVRAFLQERVHGRKF
jgi:pimeloyl-ACP methyl ester carboxylesterase